MFAILGLGAPLLTACGINYGELHPAVTPTCMKTGNIAYYYADGKYYNEQKVEVKESEVFLAKAPHSGDHHDAKEPQCGIPGNIEYWVCRSCSQKFSDSDYKTVVTDQQIVRPALEHELGELIPESRRWRKDDGLAAHYECEHCGTYFDSTGKECSKEDLIVEPNTHRVSVVGEDFSYEFDDPIPAADTIIFDIKYQHAPGKTFQFALIDDLSDPDWNIHTDYIKFENGVVSLPSDPTVTNPAGIEVYSLEEDNYERVILHPSQMKQIGNVQNVGLLTIHTGNSNISVAMEYDPLKGTIIRGQHFVPSTSESYIDSPVNLPLNKPIYIDFKFDDEPGTTKKVAFALFEDWTARSKIYEIFTNGHFVDPVVGMSIEKIKDVEGYADGYFRVTINPALLKSEDGVITNHINKLAIWKYTTASGYCVFNNTKGAEVEEYHMFEKSLYGATIDYRVTFPNVLTIKEGQSLIPGKAIQFKVKGVGTGYANFSLLELPGWPNVGPVTIEFKDGKIQSARMAGDGGQNITFDATTGLITIPLSILNGDGLSNANQVNCLYAGGNNLLSQGLEGFGVAIDTIALVDLA